MKIREILELNKEKKMPLIAKDHLPFGEKKLYAILKEIGCKPPRPGKREPWTFENVNSADLEKDVTEFGRVTANGKKETQKPNNKEKRNTRKPEIHDATNSNKPERRTKVITRNTETQPTNQENKKTVKKVTYEIDENLHYEYRMEAFRQKKNVSELVEKAMREYLENRLK